MHISHFSMPGKGLAYGTTHSTMRSIPLTSTITARIQWITIHIFFLTGVFERPGQEWFFTSWKHQSPYPCLSAVMQIRYNELPTELPDYLYAYYALVLSALLVFSKGQVFPGASSPLSNSPKVIWSCFHYLLSKTGFFIWYYLVLCSILFEALTMKHALLSLCIDSAANNYWTDMVL